MNRFLVVNESLADRMFREVIGAWFFVLALAGPAWWWGLLFLYPLVTGWTGRCPLYALLGVSTLKREPQPAETSSAIPVEDTRMKPVEASAKQESAKVQTGRAA